MNEGMNKLVSKISTFDTNLRYKLMSSEAVAKRCSAEKFFLKIPQKKKFTGASFLINVTGCCRFS